MDKFNIEIVVHFSNCIVERYACRSKQSFIVHFTVIALVIGVLGLVGIQIMLHDNSANRTDSDSEVLAQNGNFEHHPCDNFYMHACHDWILTNPKPEGEKRWNVFAVQYYKINKLVIGILEEEINEDDIDAITQAKHLYRKCLSNKEDNVLKKTFGQTGYPVVNERCMEAAKNIFNIGLAHKLALLKYKDINELEDVKTEVQQMFEKMRSWFIEKDPYSLPDIIKETKLCVGLPDWIFNDSRVQAEYTEFHLDTNATYDQQMDTASRWLRGNMDKNSKYRFDCPWTDSLGFDGAYYLKSRNIIYVPVMFLEPPYFSKNQSDGQNYGSLGTVIGHELAHAYLVPNAKRIKNSTLECIRNQYDSWTEDKQEGQNVISSFDPIVHENLADNWGLAAAYDVYFTIRSAKHVRSNHDPAWMKKNIRRQFSDEQLLFLNYAKKFCEAPTKEIMELEQHSPGMVRVLASLQNSKEFAIAWNCPAGSIMNPFPSLHEKCKLF